MWTSWIDLDNPDNDGDHETVTEAVTHGLLEASCDPQKVEARDTISKKMAEEFHGMTFNFNNLNGISCSNSKQFNGICKDFEIRICCLCK